MRSIAAESDRAYNGGPQDETYYQQSSFTPLEAGLLQDDLQFSDLLGSVKVDGQYANHLDWFAVDLEGEHSAMDGWILEEHSEYVVEAVHRVCQLPFPSDKRHIHLKSSRDASCLQ